MNKPFCCPIQPVPDDEALLFGFVDSLPWPVIVISGEGKVIRITGELVGKTDAPASYDPLGFQTLFPEYYSVLKGTVPWLVPQEAELTRRNGERIVHENIVLRRYLTGSYLIVLDQTKMHALEGSNVQTTRLAALGFMVAGVCHEVSNPVASIHSMVQILRSEKKIAPDLLEKGLSSIAGNVKRLLDISHRLLNFGRVGEEPRSAFAVDALIEEALTVIRQDRRAQHLDIVFEPDPGAVMFGSISNMQEVFVNIFENALQAMDGTGRLSIKIRRNNAERVIIEVRDTGPGIASNAMERLFEPFFTTKPAGRGSGLGLAISNEILCEHDGLITAENNTDGGACFRVDVPLHKDIL